MMNCTMYTTSCANVGWVYLRIVFGDSHLGLINE